MAKTAAATVLGLICQLTNAQEGFPLLDVDEPIREERKDLVCRPGKYGLLKMENRRIQNNHCMDHAPRTCCDDKDVDKIRAQYEILRQKSDTSPMCLAVMDSALCAVCDPDMGSGVHDGFCMDYCEHLFRACGDEYLDPYVDANDMLPLCKSDSLLCSKISDKATNGAEFCQLMGFQVSKLKEPTNRLDYDCFNGKSSVGPKYDRLDIDYKLINERDYPDDYSDDEDDPHPLSWDYIDEDGEDLFDRLGMMLFGGHGMVASLYRGVVGPGLTLSRKVYRRYLKGLISYFFMIVACLASYEMFINRRIHQRLPCCQKQSTRPRAPAGAKNLAREERIRHIQERLQKKAEEEKLQKDAVKEARQVKQEEQGPKQQAPQSKKAANKKKRQ